MHDFNCKDAKDMVNPLLAEEVRYLKETEGGQKQMCRLLEEMREEAAAEARAEGKAEGKVSDAIKMLVKGYSIEEIMEITDLPFGRSAGVGTRIKAKVKMMCFGHFWKRCLTGSAFD